MLEVVRALGQRGTIKRATLHELLQPVGLPDLNETREQAKQTLAAAQQLELVDIDREQGVSLSEWTRRMNEYSARNVVLRALDSRVLSQTETEPYFSPFYSFLLGLNAAAAHTRDGQDWANDFNRVVHGGHLPSNPFNRDKYRGLRRWLRYAGLGWADPEDVFHCNPYGRLVRTLPAVFAEDARLDIDEFMARLAAACPELDGGEIFRRSNPDYDPHSRRCTLGLGQALIELHEDGMLRLHCPRDSAGWSIELADPPTDAATMRSARVSAVELLAA